MERNLLLRIEKVSSPVELNERRAQASVAGFDGVEWSLPAPDPHQSPSGLSVLTELAECGDGRDLTVTALATEFGAVGVNEAVAKVTELLAVASRIGVRCLNLTIPSLRRSPEDRGFAGYQDAVNFTYELLGRVRLGAESSGVAVGLEAATGGCLLSPVELREIIDAANSWAVGACVDVGRIAAIGLPADWITTLRNRIHAVRLPDTECGGPNAAEQRPAADGRAIMDSLDEIGYEGIVVLPATAGTVDGRARLARLGYPVSGD